ncbi:MAG: AbrB/MazE/SpoVT family DNA-binding domain-containing protein [Verrucomicrobiae bacterium]|nr:AbrB/MazE/SpoVT family DNA-binding domain-containing protein [Verrucomicrobiae bacterium]NNJ42880.1 AbrB/MazE/SpoVT family DNA-binding domain-containing protein [Akkermansiaceae bacterium]
MNQSGQITIPKELRDRFGLNPDSDLIVTVSKDGILIKPRPTHRQQVNQWFKDEHGNELATLTTAQIMKLIH